MIENHEVNVLLTATVLVEIEILSQNKSITSRHANSVDKLIMNFAFSWSVRSIQFFYLDSLIRKSLLTGSWFFCIRSFLFYKSPKEALQHSKPSSKQTLVVQIRPTVTHQRNNSRSNARALTVPSRASIPLEVVLNPHSIFRAYILIEDSVD